MLLTLLIVDGVLSALVGALFLPLYVGAVPLPISAVVSGALNAALVWAAAQWSSTRVVVAGPLWAFAVTVVILTLGGPGGDTVFAGTASGLVGLLLLLGVGLIPAAYVLRRHV